MTTLPGLAGGTRLHCSKSAPHSILMQAHPLSTHSRCHELRSDGGKNRAWVKTIGSFISCLHRPCVVPGLQSLMATRYQDGGDSNASQERGRPSGQQPGDPQVGDPFLSPLESSYRDLLDPPPSPGLAWSRSSHPLLMAGQTGAAASSLYRPVTPLPSLVRIGGPWQLCLGRAQCSPLSLLTAILSSLAPSHWWPPQPPCAQSQLPAAYFDPRLSPELYSVPSPCQSLSHPPALASNEQ